MSRLIGPLLLLAALLSAPSQPSAGSPIVIGLDADMSSVAAEGGEAIRRGAAIAIDEINEKGGLLGRKLALTVKDHRGNPARGVDNIHEFARDTNLVAVLGGVHTPVALRELEAVHQHGMPFLVPWAAGTSIIDNGFEPNFAFRLSVRDEHAGAFLVDQALSHGHSRLALLLEQTPWGKSNYEAMTNALKARSRPAPIVEWFNWGTDDFVSQIESFLRAKADVILLVANAPEGAALVRTLAALPTAQRLPIISHWGIAAGDFPALAGPALEKVRLHFLQTFSFFNPPEPERAVQVLNRSCRLFDRCDPVDMGPAVGVAHAYDLVHLLGRAIQLAGAADRGLIRDALERVRDYSGLTGNLSRPFTPGRHDALDSSNFQLGYFDGKRTIRPLKTIRRPES